MSSLNQEPVTPLSNPNQAGLPPTLHLRKGGERGGEKEGEKKGGRHHLTVLKKGELTYWQYCEDYSYTATKDECVTLVVLAASKGTKVDVTISDGTEVDSPLEGGQQTKCTKLKTGVTITVHANNDKEDTRAGATGHLIECKPCE